MNGKFLLIMYNMTVRKYRTMLIVSQLGNLDSKAVYESFYTVF